MIVGVGIDVVDVERFGQTLERTPGLLDRLFTAEERGLPLNSLAARFAAKEALAKALGAPVGLQWHDCTVRRGEDGRPHLQVTGTVEARADALGVHAMHISLSHDAGIASAVVVAEG
ncbi:holo-ACP synthase [Nostocoides sp. HKS02]|uniref:holo-ACP synthase n=1 Tax=Nostocoides sp. HKS02 TaxID=1813880 RepID=UPI0012B45861|nr:holo-ACP synthase [Tetrasphaera sp. HKS02]QGN59184.1 holo-ACP synthase [Tetrasphaera sp. HKS02]